ncbi:MAG: hypothetical protein HFI34_04600 [Lachnospiraceae bacterium]|nr:hypothetical protein [Lachnospiraceae bacterium]
MNNYDWLKPRRRRRNLFIVEGNHEKNELMSLLLKIYPEVDIKLEDIIIYTTNIYQLYKMIADKYGDEWFDIDVDLPFIVGEKLKVGEALHKVDFMNILLIFDYERHDPLFSEEKINHLQQYFCDPTDVGKLYINYPMVESYQHLFSIPDSGYAERSILVSLQPGDKYKNLVKDTFIAHLIDLPRKMEEILSKRFMIQDKEKCAEYVEKILFIHSDENDLAIQVREILCGDLDEQALLTAQFQMKNLIEKNRYASLGKTYYEYMRGIFNEIIAHNIRKGKMIQSGEYNFPKYDLEKCYEDLSFLDILDRQNIRSRDLEAGMIWVINTSVLFIPDYNFNLIESGE